MDKIQQKQLQTDLKGILAGIDKEFKRMPHTRYRLFIAYDRFDHAINFFVESAKVGKNPKSVAIYSISSDDLEYFEILMNKVNI